LAFFGLTFDSAPQVRKGIYKMIHEIVFHGKGGYSWADVYSLPVYLRNFVFKEIKDYYEEANKPKNNPNKTTLIGPDGKVNAPAFAEASKQYQGKSSYK
jgi:hypothetical protein